MLHSVKLLFWLVHLWFFCAGFFRDGNQFNLKDERGVGRDQLAGTALAIRQLRGNKELPLGAYGHELQRLSPSLDDSIHWKGRRLTALIGAVKLGAIDQGASIIAGHSVSGSGLGVCSLSNDRVLEAAGQ